MKLAGRQCLAIYGRYAQNMFWRDSIFANDTFDWQGMDGNPRQDLNGTTLGQRLMSVLLCLAISFWSVAPSTAHTPKVIDSFQEQQQLIAEHGHSHSIEIDLLWAMHGHQHDKADHDHHSVAFLRPAGSLMFLAILNDWRMLASGNLSNRIYTLERPPKA